MVTATSNDSSPLVSYARDEMQRAGLFDPDADYGGMLAESVLNVVRVFADSGHSGMSAALALDVLGKVLRFEPLTPLTYAEDEWIDQSEISGKPLWQNRRKHDVFSEDHGATWYDLAGNKGVRA